MRKACDFQQSIEYMDSLCIYFTLVETAKMHGFNAAMTHEVNNRGRRLDNKLMGFTPESAEGFDVKTLVAVELSCHERPRGLIAKWRCIRSAIFSDFLSASHPIGCLRFHGN